MRGSIQSNVKSYLSDRSPNARYASFDYCFNHFQAARERKKFAELADDEGLVLSCLQLGFYLASWGMMRGSGDLLQKSLRELVPVVKAIASEPPETWTIDVLQDDYAQSVLSLYQRIRHAFSINASDILVTKTILGVFGCVPAFDRYFRVGFGCWTVCDKTLRRIAHFYAANACRRHRCPRCHHARRSHGPTYRAAVSAGQDH